MNLGSKDVMMWCYSRLMQEHRFRDKHFNSGTIIFLMVAGSYNEEFAALALSKWGYKAVLGPGGTLVEPLPEDLAPTGP